MALAILVNWLALRGAGDALPSAPVAGNGVPAPSEVVLAHPALDMLPDRVLQYETITHQEIPGQGERGAESVYKTLSMSTEERIETVVYARVEGLGSSSAAQDRLDELLAAYTRDRHQEQVGAAQTTVGWTEDQGAFVMAWTEGQYVTMVKATFADWVPEWDYVIIERQGRFVADAVRVFQETGRQGVSR